MRETIMGIFQGLAVVAACGMATLVFAWVWEIHAWMKEDREKRDK